MGFITDVNDMTRKKKLLENFLFGTNQHIVTITACGNKGDLKPLQTIYQDRDILERSIYAKDFDIKETFNENEYNNTYEASMSIIKKAR